MKRLIVAVLVLLLALCALPLWAAAEDAETPPAEGETETKPEEGEGETETKPPENDSLDYKEIADKVYAMIKDELPQGLAENIVKLMEQWDSTNGEDVTLADRLEEFFKPENIVTTVAMIFIVVIGITFFVLRKRQEVSIRSTNDDLLLLKKDINTQKETGEAVKKDVSRTIAALEKVYKGLSDLKEALNGNSESSEQARLAAVGVATMLKDIFQNSRTIDEAGKRMMNIDYLKAIGEPVEVSAETKPEEAEKGE